MSRYIVVGAGGIGVTFAAQLQRAGRDVVLVARGEQLAALRAGTLVYSRPDGTRSLEIPAAAGPEDLELADGDVLIVATKAQDVGPVVARWARRPVSHADGSRGLAGGSLPLVTLQNGLEAERAALRYFRTVLGAMLWVPASYVRPGEVAAPGSPAVGVVWLGRYPRGPHPSLEPVATDLRAAGFHVRVVDDIRPWKAAKLLSSVTFALAALYPPSEPRDRAAGLLREEAREILAASGHEIADIVVEPGLVSVRGGSHGGNSTWQSLARSSGLETDFLNGEIVLAARLAGRTAPVNEAVAERVHRAWRDGTEPGSLPEDDLLATLPQLRRGVLIDTVALRELLDGPEPPAVLDVRWALGDSFGAERYRDGHIPAAVYVDLDTQLAAPAQPSAGRHPLPDLAALTEAARSWGLRNGQTVVVYDDSGGLAAARAWWVLTWAGVADVRILDGALSAWRSAGFDLETGDHETARGDVNLSQGQLPVLSADEAAALARDGVLLDARSAQRYRGEIEPVDPRAGHIPWAVSAPTTDNLTADGRFAKPGILRSRFARLGAVPGRRIGVYCGSGVTAAHTIAALRIAGVDAALYPGSWSAWSADPRRPAATGPTP